MCVSLPLPSNTARALRQLPLFPSHAPSWSLPSRMPAVAHHAPDSLPTKLTRPELTPEPTVALAAGSSASVGPAVSEPGSVFSDHSSPFVQLLYSPMYMTARGA